MLSWAANLALLLLTVALLSCGGVSTGGGGNTCSSMPGVPAGLIASSTTSTGNCVELDGFQREFRMQRDLHGVQERRSADHDDESNLQRQRTVGRHDVQLRGGGERFLWFVRSEPGNRRDHALQRNIARHLSHYRDRYLARNLSRCRPERASDSRRKLGRGPGRCAQTAAEDTPQTRHCSPKLND